VTGERWSEVERIFDEALSRAPEERARFLASTCGGDAELAAEVRSLLRAHDSSAGFLDELDGARAARLLEATEESAVGATIGPYRALRELGRGGMGVVYLAERADGQFEQRVALKLIKRGMDSDEILRRFLTERQILARLEHPGIARLLDGGVTPQGQPYFALEYVEGTPLPAWADERGAGVETRLRLFREVCLAVQHAHQRLVVHRDLKPSNILVTPEGRPKLLDFGIAKLLDTRDAAGHPATRTGWLLATPEYASPEQLRGEPVGTAADVYALGMILYELLAGRRPAREGEPERPSSLAAGRLRRRLRGDLDVIVLKALHKEPERRYPSVEALLDDVDRYLGGLPIRARPDSAAYHAAKFVRRHRVAVGAAALVLLSATAGTVVALWQARSARHAAARAGAVRDFVVQMFEQADPVAAQGEQITARELLDRGTERIAVDLADQPELRAEMSALMGQLYYDLGLYDRSIELYDAALALRRDPETLLGLSGVHREKGEYDLAEPLVREALALQRKTSPGDHARLGATLNHLGLVLTEAGDYEAGEATYREALAELRHAHGGDDPEVATCLGNLGQVLKYKGDFDAAEPLYREALAMNRRLHPGDHPAVADVLGNLGVLLGQHGDLDGSIAATREALEIRRRLFGDEHPDVVLTLNNLAMAYYTMADYDAAEPLMRRVLELNRKIFGDDNRRVATNLNNLGVVLKAKGKYDEAIALYEEALPKQRKLLGEDHPYVALIETGLADALLWRGDPERAEPLIESAVATQERELEETHPRVSTALSVLGRLRLDQGRAEEAEPILRRAVRLGEATFSSDSWKLAEARALLGECLVRLHRIDEGAALLRVACPVLEDKRGTGVASTRRARAVLDGLSAG